MNYLDTIVAAKKDGNPFGITSICSAHPFVLETTLNYAKNQNCVVLIESTCNQVNQFGGYTGMTPNHFVQFINKIALKASFPQDRLIIGGDHLGPLVWSNEPADQAMDKAKVMVHDYVHAGFKKIHLDCSMLCADDLCLPSEVIAHRTAELAKVSEEVCQKFRMNTNELPRYIIGSEVPPAGGAQVGVRKQHITKPAVAGETIELTHRAFKTLGLESAWERVIALVVEPGVEFGDDFVNEYARAETAELTRFIETVPGLVFEAHSTDYQTQAKLREMVEDCYSFLKVGPALTFAFREAVFALAEIEGIMLEKGSSNIRQTIESAMLENPTHWQNHYGGTLKNQKISRSYSFSDRVRYYWNVPIVEKAFTQMLSNFSHKPLPLSLLSQYLPSQYKKIREKHFTNSAHNIITGQIMDVLSNYQDACNAPLHFLSQPGAYSMSNMSKQNV